MERLERLLNLVIALRETRRPLTAAEIRERVAGYGQPEHEAFRRMFERDKADLRALGVPVETAPLNPLGDRHGYRIDPDRYDLPQVEFEPEELAALSIAVEAAGLGEPASAGLRKLAVGSGAESPSPDASALGLALAAPHLDALAEAQVSRATVRFSYRKASPTEPPETRTVDPYALVHRRGRWYLVGRDHGRDARRAFRLDRIAGDVALVGEAGAFEPPDEVLGTNAVVPAGRGDHDLTAEVAASPEVGWLVARAARGGGRPRDDGWTLYDVPVTDPERFVAWVLSFAPQVEVVGPPALRRAVREVVMRVTDGT